MPSLADRLQSTLGPAFAIEREISGGGMSRVFVVADAALGRQVVVKILPPELSGKVDLERFRREIQIAAGLQHPCIVPVLTTGVMEGVPYFTMPYVVGESLRAQLARVGAIPVARAVRILRDVASALAHAHARGVVHRDLKPDNVLLSSGYALVADFGVAKAVSSARASDDPHLTAHGMTVGTPAYMAPEQALADPGADHRVDLYSLGVMAYELLAGRRPFAAASAQEMLVAHITGTPEPLDRLRPELPPTLVTLVMQCLAKKPDDRPSATGIVETLDAVVSTIGSGGTPPSARAMVAAGIALPPGALPSIAVLPFRNLSTAPENDYFADGITEEILNALARLRTLHVAARTSSFAFKGKDVDLRTVGEQLGVRSVLEGSVRRSGNRLRIAVQLIDTASGFQLWSERYDRELADVFDIQEEIAEAIVRTLEVTLLGSPGAPIARRATRDVEAYELYLRGRYFWNAAGSGFERALELFEQALARDPDFALAHAGMADVFIGVGVFEFMPPGEAFPLARAAAERALAIDPSLSEAHSALGAIRMFHDWDLAGGRESLERAIALNPANVYAYTWLAMHHALAGDPGTALEWARRAITVDPLAAPALYGELYALHSAQRHADVVECARRVLELNPAYAEGYRSLGLALLALGRTDEGLEALQQAVTLGGRGAWYVANLAVGRAHLGDADEARRLLAELHERSEREWVSPTAAAIVHLALGERDEALAALERAYEARDPWIVSLPVELGWAALRGDPRFEALVEKAGLSRATAGAS